MHREFTCSRPVLLLSRALLPCMLNASTKEYVVIGFGLFFVFREKQLPEYKLRNFKKTAQKPISAARRLSSISSKASSTQVLCNHYPLTNKEHTRTKLPLLLYYWTRTFSPRVAT